MKTKETSYCVNGTSVRNDQRSEVTNKEVFIPRETAERVKDALRNAFLTSRHKEYTFKNLRVAIRK